MELQVAVWGADPWVNSAAILLESVSSLSCVLLDPEGDDLMEVVSEGLDFVVVAASPDAQSDLVMQALAADAHLLAVDYLGATVEEAQRCVTIALNRGLRLGVLKLTEPIEPQIEQFAAWIEGGIEPEHSGRRWLARQFGPPS